MSFKYTPNTLKKMEQLLHEADYTVRYEKGNFASGSCLLEDKRIVVVNKFLSVEGRINALIELIINFTFNEERLSGEMAKWLQELRENPVANTQPAPAQTKMDL